MASQRATDETVRAVLVWARNYEEISSFRALAVTGRRWRVEIPEPRLIGSGLFASLERPEDFVPRVMVFTPREALAFGYGCAAGGIHDRAEFARERWGWE